MTGSSCCRCCCCIGVAVASSIGLLTVDDCVVVELLVDCIRLLELVVVVVVVVVVVNTIGVVVWASCWSTLNADVTFRVASAVSCFVVI